MDSKALRREPGTREQYGMFVLARLPQLGAYFDDFSR